MERHYKAKKIGDIYVIEYEYKKVGLRKWVKTIFKGWDGKRIEFFKLEHANQWIQTRYAVMNIPINL
jgi:hypothetical protein